MGFITDSKIDTNEHNIINNDGQYYVNLKVCIDVLTDTELVTNLLGDAVDRTETGR